MRFTVLLELSQKISPNTLIYTTKYETIQKKRYSKSIL